MAWVNVGGSFASTLTVTPGSDHWSQKGSGTLHSAFGNRHFKDKKVGLDLVQPLKSQKKILKEKKKPPF